MPFVESFATTPSGFVARLERDDGFIYVTDTAPTVEDARVLGRAWLDWYENVASGKASSVYYILAIPQTWPGPPDRGHRYSGLRVKIGRAKNVMKRLADLRTGTSEDLIVHALEPGGAVVERARHRQFADDRVDEGREWFHCSPALTEHIFRTWHKNNALPREHQIDIVRLQERIEALFEVRKHFSSWPPDLVNPSLNESWRGKTVFVDLAYTGWRTTLGRPLRAGAIEIDSITLDPLRVVEEDDPLLRGRRRTDR